MSTNHTPNYALSQWERTDKVLMDDFNADNAKIDAALKAETDARAAGDAALTAALARKGNCRVVYRVYTGTGAYGPDNPTVHTFSGKPLLVVIASHTIRDVLIAVNGSKAVHYDFQETKVATFGWEDNSFSLYSASGAYAQMNHSGEEYTLIAFIAED